RRTAPPADPLHLGGGRLGRHLRPQCVAARALRGARDHRADQGSAALVGDAHSLASAHAWAAAAERRAEKTLPHPCIGAGASRNPCSTVFSVPPLRTRRSLLHLPSPGGRVTGVSGW